MDHPHDMTLHPRGVFDVDFAQIFIRMASLPMSYVENKVRKRVRLLPDFYITRLRPVARWEGVIIGTVESLAGPQSIECDWMSVFNRKNKS
jgi:hypothetical protein